MTPLLNKQLPTLPPAQLPTINTRTTATTCLATVAAITTTTVVATMTLILAMLETIKVATLVQISPVKVKAGARDLHMVPMEVVQGTIILTETLVEVEGVVRQEEVTLVVTKVTMVVTKVTMTI